MMLVTIILLLPVVANSAGIYYQDLNIYPEFNITTQDTVFAELSGEFATSGFQIDGNPVVDISNDIISIQFNSTSPTGVVLNWLVPFSVDAELGQFNPGTYNVTALFSVDGVVQHVLNDSFNVSAVPLPAGIWFLGSGLIALFPLYKKLIRS